MINFLEFTGIIYIVSVSYAVITDFLYFVKQEQLKQEYRNLQKIKYN